MMAHDPPPPPPWTEAAVVLPDTLELIGCDKSRSGMFIDNRGRLSLVIEGHGVRASFGGSADVAAIAKVLAHLAELMAANERQAADAAGGALNRIVASTYARKPN
jgi:hypothetical protein